MSDTDIDTRPQVVNVVHYGGDTLVLHVRVTPEIIGGREFSAQVRSQKISRRIDASFQVILTPTGADIQLLSEDCQRLTERGPYTGWWDVQLAMPDGSDPVTTLAYGELKLDPDVTRSAV